MNCLRLFLLAVCVPLALCSLALGQNVTGAVSGVVTDPSGAVVPDAIVVIHNVGTGVDSTAKTNADGAYSVRFPRDRSISGDGLGGRVQRAEVLCVHS